MNVTANIDIPFVLKLKPIAAMQKQIDCMQAPINIRFFLPTLSMTKVAIEPQNMREIESHAERMSESRLLNPNERTRTTGK